MPPSALSRRHQSARRVAVVSGQARGSGQCASRLNLTRLDSTGCRVLGQACRRGAALTWSAGNLAGATRSSGCKSCPRPGQRRMTVVSCCGSLATLAPWPVLASSNARALACAGTSSSSRCLPPLRGGLSHEVAFHRCHVGAQPRRHSLDCAALPAGAIRHIPQLVLEESPVPGDESIALAHTPPAVASACLHVRAAASRDGQRAAGASKPAARGSATTGAVQQQRGARSGSLTRSWRTGHCCALPARAAAQPQPCPHTRGSRHHQIMSAVPVCRRRRARTRGREECTSERAEDAGTAWERSHLSASGLALRLLIEVVGDGVLRWLFAVMNLAGALTSGIARPSRACTVGNSGRERDGPQEGAQTRSCAGGLVRPKLVASAAWGAVSSALARLLPSPCRSAVCRALSL